MITKGRSWMAKLDLQTINVLHKGLIILHTFMAGSPVTKRQLMKKTGLGERQMRHYLHTLSWHGAANLTASHA